jgi:hypothetical protein
MVFINDASGRAHTDFRASCIVNQELMKLGNATDAYQYKMFIQRNASKIMELDRQRSQKVGFKKCTCKKS